MSEEKQITYGGVNDRMFASTLDLAILYLVVSFFTRIVFEIIYPGGSEYEKLMTQIVTDYPSLQGHLDQIFALAVGKYPERMHLVYNQMAFLAAFQFILLGFYFVPMTKIYGATFGKKIVGLKVVDNITGKEITYSQSVIRYIGYVPSALFVGFGIFSAAFNRKKRAWHDYAADTVVIYDENRWYKKQFDKLKRYFHLK
jgi:uncharacterized RDD family membrane protein YckC